MQQRYRAGITAAFLCVAAPLAVEEACAQAAANDSSLTAFERLLQSPNDAASNLAYAQSLQAAGQTDEARQVYQKVLTLDPQNATARAALASPSVALAPQAAQTDYTLRLGGAYETNSPRRPSNFRSYDDVVGFGEFTVNDTRQIGDVTFQSNFDLYSNFHNRYSPGDLSYVAVDTGPVLNLNEMGKLRVAIGGEYVLQGPSPIPADGHHSREFEFDAVNAIFNWFPPVKMPLQSVNLLVGYDNFRNAESFRNGVVMRLTAPFIYDEVTPFHTQLIVTPGFVYNGAEEPVVPLQAAHYKELDLDVLTLTPLAERQLGVERILGKLGGFLDGQLYDSHDVTTRSDRRDVRVIPLVGLRFINVWATPVQLDLDYRYDHNFSSESAERFSDHIVSLTATIKF